jgi:hypothetical protein
MYPHRIRLRGPWQCEVPAGTEPRRLTLPCPWEQLAGAEFTGSVRLVRNFGYPGNVDPSERVWLMVEGCAALTGVELNEASRERQRPGEAPRALSVTPVANAPGSPVEWDVTTILSSRNRLVFTLTTERPRGALWDEVALEIRKTAYLRASASRREHDVIVRGVVIGAAERALELYALVGGQSAHYETIAANAEGTPFTFTLSSCAADVVRLDLVHVAESWCTLDVPVE